VQRRAGVSVVMAGGPPHPFIGAGRSTKGAVPAKKRSPLMAAILPAFRAH
jgi:hypothetical protein